jgi:hypothetical protein
MNTALHQLGSILPSFFLSICFFISGCVNLNQKTIISNFTTVTIVTSKGSFSVPAKIDTGANSSSISYELAKEIGLEELDETIVIRSASCNDTRDTRPLAIITFEIEGHKITTRVGLAERGHMDYPLLIGSKDLHGLFLVEPEMTSN